VLIVGFVDMFVGGYLDSVGGIADFESIEFVEVGENILIILKYLHLKRCAILKDTLVFFVVHLAEKEVV
jgi:hypothetical protein